MSVNASKHELIHLIHRHLKEQGFNSAAEELQKQSPQNEPSTSTTLLDIYSSWLKSSKRKAKSTATKRTTEKKQATGKKAAQKKKTDKTTKQPGKLDKKSTSPKRKKGDVKAKENIVKSNKSKSPKKEVPVPGGGEDSDSDSSLDVEKWKKLVQHMTDTDIAKINEFNALTQPKRQRVRKPQAKTNATETQQSNSQNSIEDVSAKKTPRKNMIWMKKNEVTPITSVISPKQNPKKEKRKAESPVDPAEIEPKKKRKKEASKKKLEDIGEGDKNLDNNQAKIEAKNDNPTTGYLTEQSKVNADNTDIEHKKKKKKEASKKKVGENNGSVIEKNINNNEEKREATNGNPTEGKLTEQSTANPLTAESKPRKKKKKERLEGVFIESGDIVDKNALVGTDIKNTTNDRGEDEKGNPIVKSLTQNGTINSVEDESIVKVKKGNKRKKDKTQDVVESKELVSEADSKTDANISEELNEKAVEENEHSIAEMIPKKKKKKKDKKKEEPETLETVIDEAVASVDDISEQVSVKKKSKKKKKEALDDFVSERTEEEQVQDTENVNTPKTKESNGGNDASVPTSEHKKKKEKKLLMSLNSEAETQLVPPSTPQTPSLSTKKKKNKAASEEITQALGDATSENLESETPKKKKKKSCKTSETET